MARLPQPGGDAGNWGSILNDYLSASHKSDGTIKDNVVTANVLAPNSVTSVALADNSVSASTIADGSITNAKLTTDAVSKPQLASGLRSELDEKLSISAADVAYASVPKPGRNALTGWYHVDGYGAVADGNLTTRLGTDNSDAFRQAIADAKLAKGVVYVPEGIYSVAQTIPRPSDVTIRGAGSRRTRIVCPTPGIPVIASESWLTEFGGSPSGGGGVEGLTVCAEALNPGSHGIVQRDYWGNFRDIIARQCGGDGFRPDSSNQGGVIIPSTLVENHYENLFADQCRGWGFNQNGQQLTDSHMINVVARGVAQAGNPEAAEAIGGISIPYSAGWQVSKIHTYGRFRTDAVVFGNCWGGSILDGVYIEHGYENAGLRIPNFQRGGAIDNISIAMSEYGNRIMFDATKHATLYPGEGIQVGTLSLVSSFPGAGAAVRWNSTSAMLQISNFSLAGASATGITQFDGGGAANIKVGADLPAYLTQTNLEALIQQKIDDSLESQPTGPTPEYFAFSDDFNRSNGTAGNTAVGNLPWTYQDTAPTGGMAIDANRMRLIGASSVTSAVVDAGVSNGWLIVTLAVTDVGNTGVVFRSVDAGNQFRLSRAGSSDKRYTLTRRVGGASTTVVTLTTQIADGDQVRVVLNGSIITLFINDVQEWAGSDSTHLNATKHGVYNGANSLLMYDNISFTVPASN